MAGPQPQTFPGARGEDLVLVQLRDIYQAVLDGMKTTTNSKRIDQVDLEGVDPIAIAQNTCVHVEKQLGLTYPRGGKL